MKHHFVGLSSFTKIRILFREKLSTVLALNNLGLTHAAVRKKPDLRLSLNAFSEPRPRSMLELVESNKL